MGVKYTASSKRTVYIVRHGLCCAKAAVPCSINSSVISLQIGSRSLNIILKLLNQIPTFDLLWGIRHSAESEMRF